MIVYLSQEELNTFASSEAEAQCGYAYEWEGEGVVHLHTQPLAHAFGRVSKCFFSKTAPNVSFLNDVLYYLYLY